MVRMSNPGDRTQSPAYGGVPARPGGLHRAHRNPVMEDFRPQDIAGESAWPGAGGRWIIWPLRAVLWAALVVVAVRGIIAIVAGDTSPAGGGGAAAPQPSSQFPVTLAEAYALDFGQAYLNFNPATQAQREQALAAFVPPSLATSDPDLGWNGSGQAQLESEHVAGISVRDSRHAVVSLLATVSGQLMELGVPVYAAEGGMVVSGVPAWLSAPPAITPSPQAAASPDPVAQSELMNQLPAFFQAYAGGDGASLNRFLAPGVSLTGLGGGVAFDAITGLLVPRGGSSRDITVTVVWQVLNQGNPTSAKLAMSYRVSVVDLQSGKWYVKGISASTEAVGGQ
jgi:Conjugative transposon protein TcpC